MKKFAFCSLLLATLCIMGCDKDPMDPVVIPVTKTDLTLNFKATFDGAQLEKDKAYPYKDYNVKFSLLTLFVSNVTLLKGTEETLLTDAQFMPFTESGASNLTKTFSYTIKNLPTGDYTGIRIRFGVDSITNAKTPADFAAGHPLTNENEYWGGWRSYIFSKIEGKADVGKNNNYDVNFMYHCGSVPDLYVDVSRAYAFDKSMAFTTAISKLDIELDIKKLFVQNGDLMDLNDPINCSAGFAQNDYPLTQKIMDNWKLATTVK